MRAIRPIRRIFRAAVAIGFVASVVATLAVTSPATAAWFTFHRLVPSPTASFYFGAAMAALDDRFLVGDPGDSTLAPFAGAVHLIDARTGEIVLTIHNPDPQPYAQFGLAVALRGSDVVVAAPQHAVGGGTEVGVVYVFDGTTGALEHTLANPTPATGDYFGQALAANATSILVGARGDGDPPAPGAPSPGAAYLFDGSTGALLRSFAPPGLAVLSFGAAVGFAGDDALVGSVNDSSAGLLSGGVYRFDGASGGLTHVLHRPTPQIGTGFGSRVASLGEKPVVAAVFDDLAGVDAGAIYLFDESGALADTFPNPHPDNVVPGSIGQVTVDGIDDRLLAGGFFHSSDGSTPGGDSVYVIDTADGTILETLEGPAPFGTELAASFVVATGGRIVVSSYGNLFVFDPVGNSYLGLGEQCDDGNAADGDGCSARGRLEAPTCPAAPRGGCHPAGSGRASLRVRAGSGPGRASLAWGFRGASGGDLLVDPSSRALHLCVYDARPAPLRASLDVPVGAACVTPSCWRSHGDRSSFRDPAGASDGVRSMIVRGSPGGSFAARLNARGPALPLPALPLTLPVTVQLVQDDGACWTSDLVTAATNDSRGLRAKSD